MLYSDTVLHNVYSLQVSQVTSFDFVDRTPSDLLLRAVSETTLGTGLRYHFFATFFVKLLKYI